MLIRQEMSSSLSQHVDQIHDAGLSREFTAVTRADVFQSGLAVQRFRMPGDGMQSLNKRDVIPAAGFHHIDHTEKFIHAGLGVLGDLQPFTQRVKAVSVVETFQQLLKMAAPFFFDHKIRFKTLPAGDQPVCADHTDQTERDRRSLALIDRIGKIEKISVFAVFADFPFVIQFQGGFHHRGFRIVTDRRQARIFPDDAADVRHRKNFIRGISHTVDLHQFTVDAELQGRLLPAFDDPAEQFFRRKILEQ